MVRIVFKEISIWDVLFWIIMTLLFIMLLTRMFGSSASDLQIFFTFLSILLIGMGHIIKLNREVGEMKVGIKYSFNKVKEDTTLLRNNMNLIRKDTSSMKEDIKEIKENMQLINKKLRIR